MPALSLLVGICRISLDSRCGDRYNQGAWFPQVEGATRLWDSAEANAANCVLEGKTMAYCRKCGALIDDYAAVCPKCGTPQNGGPNNPPPAADNGGFLWGLLGCCIPIAGLILFLVWKDTKPRTAKAAGIGALVCVIAYVLMYVAAAVLGISAAVYAY